MDRALGHVNYTQNHVNTSKREMQVIDGLIPYSTKPILFSLERSPR